MVAFIQKAHGCIFFYDAIEVQEAQLAISDRLALVDCYISVQYLEYVIMNKVMY